MKQKMHHFVLLVAALLMAATVGAQTWTASAPGEGTFYLYNVGNAGFLFGSNDNTTRASLTSQGGIPVTLTAASEGYYVSTAPTYADRFLGSDGYVDKVNTSSKYCSWKFVAVEGQEDTYLMQAANTSTNSGYYLVGHASTASKTSVTSTQPTNEKGYWKLVTKDALIANLANATAENPIDVTFTVKNPYFGAYCDVSLWSGDYTAYNGVANNKCIEQFNRTFDMSQTITGLPNGVYKMTCQGFYRMGGRTNAKNNRIAGTEALNAKYYINTTEGSLMSIFDDDDATGSYKDGYNENSAYVVNETNHYLPNTLDQASNCFLAGYYQNAQIRTVVTDGTIKIGIRKTTTVGDDWAAYDNVVLTYYGIDLTALVTSYEELLAEAKTLQSEPMQASVKTALDNAVTTAETDVNTSSQEWLENTLSSLGTAITNARASNTLYEGAILTAVNGMKAQSTSDDVKSAVQTKYDNREYATAAEVYAYYQPLEIAALGTEANTVFTSAIINPGFELGNTDGWSWEVAGDDTNVHHTNNDTYSYSGTEGDYLFNTWANSIKTLDVQQTVTGLPLGYYTLSAVVASFGDEAPIIMSANGISNSVSPKNDDVDGEKVNGHTLTLENIFVSNGTLTFRVQNTGKGQTLLKCDAFTLTLTQPYTPLENYTDLVYNVNLENSEVAEYLANTTYDEATATVIGNYDTDAANRYDQPRVVTLEIPYQTVDATLYVSLNSDYSAATTQTITAGNVMYDVVSLLPGKTYYYKVEANDAIVSNGTITTTGTLRMIKADGVSNMRDLGGWTTTDGGTIRYGKLFRGSELRGGKTYTATDDALAFMKNELNIAAEVDLREDVDFASGTLSNSAIDGATYYYANLSRWSEDALNFDNAKFKSGFDLILTALRAGKAAYFHCIFGADRTGCFAFLLEGLMGVPVDQLYKDYELTSFSSAGTRDKTGIDHKLQYIKALQGDNLQQKFYNYWRGAVGVSESDLNEFINIMVDGENSITTAELADLPEKQVEDGKYYLYLSAYGQFISRARSFGTQGVPDRYGIPAEVRTNGVGVTTIQFLDNELFFGSDGYADKDAAYNTVSWFVEKNSDDKLVLHSHNGNYMYLKEGTRVYVDAANIANATPVAFKTAAEQQAIVAATQNANILSAATAAGISAESVNDFTTALSNDFTATASTATINGATAGSTTAWVLSEPNARNETANYGNAYNVGDYGGELYQKNASVSQTVTVPHAGLYKLTLNALYRQGSNELCYAAGQAGFDNMSNAYVSINDTYFAQIPSWYSDCASDSNPNTTDEAKTLMEGGKYAVEVYAYIGETKEATITINVPGFTPFGWCIFNNFALTEYAKTVTIAETATEVPAACDFANVTLTRTLQPEIYNTFSVPFSLSKAQIEASALNGATIYAFESSDATTINFESVTAMEAGKPYLVQLPAQAEAIANPSFSGVTVEANAGETVGTEGNIQFVAQIYNKSLSGVADVCYLATNGQVKKLASEGAIKGLRAYFLVPDAVANANEVKMNFRNTLDAIEMPTAEKTSKQTIIYNLSGQRLQRLQRGINIVNGKKVMVK